MDKKHTKPTFTTAGHVNANYYYWEKIRDRVPPTNAMAQPLGFLGLYKQRTMIFTVMKENKNQRAIFSQNEIKK